MFDKLEFNNGFIVENIVAQMLRASLHTLYYYNNASKESADRMEIDFLIGDIEEKDGILYLPLYMAGLL